MDISRRPCERLSVFSEASSVSTVYAKDCSDHCPPLTTAQHGGSFQFTRAHRFLWSVSAARLLETCRRRSSTKNR